jgi:hypothetical protein
MKSGRKIMWWTGALVVAACSTIVFLVLSRTGEPVTIPSQQEYPVLDPNEKLEDVSFGWYRPLGVKERVFQFDGEFPKMPDKMLLYKILRPENVTEAYVRELAKKYFNMPSDAVFKRNGPYCNLNTENHHFMFEASTGFFNIFKHKKARARLSDDRKDYPSEEDCKRIATEYLKERGLLPEDAYLSGTADNIGAVGAISVWFGRTGIGQFKAWGGGSEILVEVGVDGEITKVAKRWLEFEPYKLAPIIAAKEAFERLKHGNALLAGSGKVTKITLAYLVEPVGDYIQPVYSFRFERPGAYAAVPALKQEYLKSQEEMIRERQRTSRIQPGQPNEPRIGSQPEN